MPSELATVDPLPGILWNAHAVLGDAMQRAPMDAALVVMWIGGDGQTKTSCSANNQETVWLCAQTMQSVLSGS